MFSWVSQIRVAIPLFTGVHQNSYYVFVKGSSSEPWSTKPAIVHICALSSDAARTTTSTQDNRVGMLDQGVQTAARTALKQPPFTLSK